MVIKAYCNSNFGDIYKSRFKHAIVVEYDPKHFNNISLQNFSKIVYDCLPAATSLYFIGNILHFGFKTEEECHDNWKESVELNGHKVSLNIAFEHNTPLIQAKILNLPGTVVGSEIRPLLQECLKSFGSILYFEYFKVKHLPDLYSNEGNIIFFLYKSAEKDLNLLPKEIVIDSSIVNIDWDQTDIKPKFDFLLR